MKVINEKAFGARFKLIYSAVQMFLFYLLICLFPNYDLLCIIAIPITYLIPLYINSYLIKFSCRDKKLSEYILEDTVYYYLPSIALSLLIELALYFFGVTSTLLCFYTVVLFIIFTLMTAFQWLKCFLHFKINNSMKKGNKDEKNK